MIDLNDLMRSNNGAVISFICFFVQLALLRTQIALFYIVKCKVLIPGKVRYDGHSFGQGYFIPEITFFFIFIFYSFSMNLTS